MNRAIEIGLLLFVIIGAAYLYGEKRYKNGHDSATAQCQSGINSLQKALSDSNAKAVKLSEKQKQSLSIALEMQRKSIAGIKKDLDSKVLEIERLKNESDNNCVNARIPDSFK